MTKLDDLHTKWMENPEYRNAYDALETEFSLAAAIIKARCDAGLTQHELAQRIQTKQSVIARLEGGKSSPTTKTLKKIAEATNSKLIISFEHISVT